MSGEMNLSKLLADMRPVILPERYVFCTTEKTAIECFDLNPLATFQESEGLTLVLNLEVAESNGFDVSSPMCCITLQIHSSLDAVGLTAAVSEALTEHQISANVIAAYFHDHIFVPERDAEKALDALQALSARHRSQSE